MILAVFRPERDSNLDLCDASAVLYQLSYQAYWELVVRWVDEKPADDGYKSIYMVLVHEIRVFEVRIEKSF